MMRKLKQQKGETLIEALIAMLICVMSMALLSTSVLTATNVNKANRAADEEYSSQLQQAEGFLGSSKHVTVKLTFHNGEVEKVTANLYGGEGTFISYDYQPEEK